MLKPLKVATPLTEIGRASCSGVPGGPAVPIARLTLLVAPVLRAPNWCHMSTVSAGVIVVCALVLVGCCTKHVEVASGAGAVMLKALEVAPVSPVLLAVRV